MSRHSTEEIICPSCNQRGDFEIWNSVNTMLNPEMKEKVLSHEVFRYTCPNCGKTFNLMYPLLYHQMEDRIMIYLVEESEVESAYKLFTDENLPIDFHSEKYLNRIVTSINQLTEKIRIFDAGKDDRIIELIKFIVKDKLKDDSCDKNFDEMFFNENESGNSVLVLFDNGKYVGTVDIALLYEEFSPNIDKLGDICEDDIIIDAAWAYEKFSDDIS